jgi:hypothetical protein
MLMKIYDVGFKGGGDVDSAAQSALRVALQCVSASPIGLLLPRYAPKWEVIFLDDMFSNSPNSFLLSDMKYLGDVSRFSWSWAS